MKQLVPLAFVFCLGLTACPPPERASEEEMRLGQLALTDNDTPTAIRHLTEALRQEPELEMAWLLRCEAHYRRKEYAAALADARQVLARNPGEFTPTDYTALYNLGVIYNSRREFAAGRRYLLRALAHDSTDVRLYESLGYGYLEQNNPAAALRQFQAILRQDDQLPKAHYGVGRSRMLLQQYPAAVAAFDQAIRLDSTYAMAYQNRGGVRFLQGDQAGGCADWQRAIALGLKELESIMPQYCPGSGPGRTTPVSQKQLAAR